jgi:hypothetical protein
LPYWRLPYPSDGILREFRQEVAADLDDYTRIRDMLRDTFLQSTPLMDMELPITESNIQDMATDDSERF